MIEKSFLLNKVINNLGWSERKYPIDESRKKMKEDRWRGARNIEDELRVTYPKKDEQLSVANEITLPSLPPMKCDQNYKIHSFWTAFVK